MPSAATLARIAKNVYTTGNGVFEGFQKTTFSFNGSDSGAVYENASDFVIAITGSDDIGDWIKNAEALPVRRGSLGHVHDGFVDAADEAIKILKSQWLPKIGNRALFCTGHSRGGAIATLLATKLRLLDRNTFVESQNLGSNFSPVLSTYGSPRVGLQDFGNIFNGLGILATRYKHGYDVVTMIPTKPIDFVHVGSSVHLEKKYSWYNNWFYKKFGNAADHSVDNYVNKIT